MAEQPSKEQLRRWRAEYRRRAKADYAALVASYTAEQQALAQQINQSRAQAELCSKRLGGWNVRPVKVWPKDPFAD